jgi:tubulin polyglutamylase TTLL5
VVLIDLPTHHTSLKIPLFTVTTTVHVPAPTSILILIIIPSATLLLFCFIFYFYFYFCSNLNSNSSSQYRGIVLVRDVASLTYSQTSVIQKYVQDPLCLEGYKFDLRLYVLVTSFKPLEAFIYTDGFARVSTKKYSLSREDMDNKFIHLTNSSIQKMNEMGPGEDSPLMNCTESGGSKIPLKGPQGLWARLERMGMDTAALWRDISILVVKSLVIVDDKMTHQPCAFEVFGYDILIDSKLRCWLLEVNASPSMARENALDIRVKDAMVRDTIALVAPAPYDRAAVARVLKRRFNDISKNNIAVGRSDGDLEKDLRDILGDTIPRRYGENPAFLGDYEKLCPNTRIHTHVLKLKSRIIKSD